MSAIQTPRLSESAYDSGGSGEMESFLRGMVVNMRADLVKSDSESDHVLEEADPEQEYDEEIQAYGEEIE